MLIDADPAAASSDVTSLQSEITALRNKVQSLEQELRHRHFVEQKLEHKIQDLLRRMFGPKSEKLDPNQMQLLLEQILSDQALRSEVPPQPVSREEKQVAPRRGGGRRPAPEHLPIERVEIDLPEVEREGLVRIREQITEEIDYRPSQFFRRHYVRFVYAHPHKAHAPVMAPLPPRVLPGSSVGVGLLAHLLVSKYVDHVPLNRIEQIAARVDVSLPRQNQTRWVEDAALLLRLVQEHSIHPSHLGKWIRSSGRDAG